MSKNIFWILKSVGRRFSQDFEVFEENGTRQTIPRIFVALDRPILSSVRPKMVKQVFEQRLFYANIHKCSMSNVAKNRCLTQIPSEQLKGKLPEISKISVAKPMSAGLLYSSLSHGSR